MEASFNDARSRKWALTAAVLVTALSCFRLAHVHLLWADEDYHLAAAINLLRGKIPYRDFWYDKPPLTALYYLLIGGFPGWPLRLMDAAYTMASCYMAYRIASVWWTRVEGYAAALLLAFFTTFYLPSAVIPFAADAVMLLPHLLAIYYALVGKPLLAGCFAGIAFLANTKAIFVVAGCAIFLGPATLWLGISFALTSSVGLGLLAALGAWPGYVEQVWRWGFIYAKESPVLHPWVNGSGRTLNWIGFHLFPVLAAGYYIKQAKFRDRWRLGCWIALSFVAVALGNRFAPHYFLQLLPSIVIAASRGITLAAHRHGRQTSAAALLLLAVPLVRFGPRYFELARDTESPHWADVAMDLDSRAVARKIEASSQPGRYAICLGLSSGCLRLHEEGVRQPLLGFSTPNRRSGRPPSLRERPDLWRRSSEKPAGIGPVKSGLDCRWIGLIKSQTEGRCLSRSAELAVTL